MPSEIYTRLETLLARTGLNGPIAKAEAAAEAEALENVKTYLSELENGVFLTDAAGEYLHRFQRQIRPAASKCTPADMAQKMADTPRFFYLGILSDLILGNGIDFVMDDLLHFTIGQVNAENCPTFADELRILLDFFPPLALFSLGENGITWTAFDALERPFYVHDRTPLNWQMIQTIGGNDEQHE